MERWEARRIVTHARAGAEGHPKIESALSMLFTREKRSDGSIAWKSQYATIAVRHGNSLVLCARPWGTFWN